MRVFRALAAVIVLGASSALAGNLESVSLTATTEAPSIGVVHDGETIYFELGDRFTGELGGDGGTAYANFNGVYGTEVTLDVTGMRLNMELMLLDASGAELDLGDALTINGKKAKVDKYMLPASGNYTFAITGSPPNGLPVNNGSFQARSKGTLPGDVLLTKFWGRVTNAATDEPLAGATVDVDPYLLVTSESGDYCGWLPAGVYDVVYEAPYFNAHAEPVVLFPLVSTRLDVALTPNESVIVSADVDGDAVPGALIEALADILILDGSTLLSIEWTQVYGTPAMISDADMADATVELAGRFEYKEELYQLLSEPPIGPDQLPPNVPPPAGEFPGGLQDRFQVTGVNPFALEETGLITLKVEVVTTSGTYSDEVDVHAHLEWSPAGGIENVPTGIPVLIHGKEQASYNWMMTTPVGSNAMLLDADTRYPEFTPDLPGLYVITVDFTGAYSGSMAPAETVILNVYAGTWRGVIVGQDNDGFPVSDPGCTGCHDFIGDQFTEWSQSGHARIFSDNLDTSTHYGTGCFPCHTVGFDGGVDNGGFDDAPDYLAFLGSGLLNNPGDNWTTMLADYPAAAQLANIQCENCHGPQEAGAGMPNDAHTDGTPRMTLSSDGCATCHGEPPRHGRFQQWQLSSHADYELAIDEGESGNCSRCHTANGFLAWMPALMSGNPALIDESITVTWTPDEVHPQTCTACHDPHDIGTASGDSNNATVRINGNTPWLLAGYTAYGVGRGAICMTCHNSRRGLRNDATFPAIYGTSEAARAPHGPTQTDMLMGESGYLVTVGFRGNHSFLPDTCTKCHMAETPPPDDISYNNSGTNHTFFASIDVCAECHTGYDGESIQEGVHDTLDQLQALIESGLFDYIDEQTALGNKIDMNGQALITNVAQIADIEFGDTRGRQAMTITFTDDSVVGPMRMTDIDILDAADVVLGEFYDFAEPNLIKAGWNWLLVHNDGSFGVHNPSYSYNVLAASIGALNAWAPVNIPDWVIPLPAPQTEPMQTPLP